MKKCKNKKCPYLEKTEENHCSIHMNIKECPKSDCTDTAKLISNLVFYLLFTPLVLFAMHNARVSGHDEGYKKGTQDSRKSMNFAIKEAIKMKECK